MRILRKIWCWLYWTAWRLKPLPKPKKQRVALWVQALKSGDFKQAYGGVRVGDAFCCLGVACEVFRLATGRGSWANNGVFIVDGFDSGATMPVPVSKWYGIPSDPVLQGFRAVNRNDSMHEDFNQIARAAEAEYLVKP